VRLLFSEPLSMVVAWCGVQAGVFTCRSCMCCGHDRGLSSWHDRGRPDPLCFQSTWAPGCLLGGTPHLHLCSTICTSPAYGCFRVGVHYRLVLQGWAGAEVVPQGGLRYCAGACLRGSPSTVMHRSSVGAASRCRR
jgi:hypothetical protein